MANAFSPGGRPSQPEHMKFMVRAEVGLTTRSNELEGRRSSCGLKSSRGDLQN